MTPFRSHYPEFVPNQILTNTQLNQLRDHLDRQDQLSRVRLAGTGIVCGLTWSIDAAGAVALAEGYGVTSDGHLVELAAGVFTHAVPYEDPGVDEDGEPVYEPWRDGTGGQIELFELLDAAAVADLEVTPQPLDATLLGGRVLVLYLEREPVALRSCIVTDCNNTGTNVHLNARVLLVSRDALQAVTPCPPPPALTRLPRFHTATPLVDLGTAGDVDGVYQGLVQAALPTLSAAVQAAFDAHGPRLDVDVAPGLAALDQVVADAGTIHQLHHDLLKDLADALDEAVTGACELAAECCPASLFPRHLMLGDLDVSDGFTAAGFRHAFRPAPLRDVTDGDRERVRRLFLRLAAMLANVDVLAFDRSGTAAVRLTPSRTEDAPLGRRALPRYFTPEPDLERHWQPRLCCTTEPLWTYHRPGDLDVDAGRADFLRVEGHLGHARAAAADAIAAARRQHNVPFALRGARFGQPASEAAAFHAFIASYLADRALRLADLETVFFDSAGAGSVDEGGVTSGVDNVASLDRSMTEESAAQAARLLAWRTWCDPATLFTAWRAARGELSCALHRLLGEIAKTPAFFDPNVFEPGEVPAARARVMLADRRLVRLLATGAEGGDVPGEVQAVRDEIAALTADVAPWVLLPPAAEALAASIRRLLAELPESPEGVGVEVLLERVRTVWADALYYWLLWRASDALPAQRQIGVGRKDDPGDWVLPALAACEPARLVELALAYEALRRRDLGWFVNLAAAADGLEHLGGVVKGGTFVLVVDAGGTVSADFALPGRPPCCCEIDPSDVCRPPLALPDHRVVQLRRVPGTSGFEPITVLFDVLANDSDPNDLPARDHLSVVLKAVTTPLGGTLEEDSGVIRYFHENPRPGCVDRFSYTLSANGERCAGEATGDVLILTVGEPVSAPGAGPGEITGRVASAADDAPVFGAQLVVIDLGRESSTDDKGLYTLPEVPPGVYQVRATHRDFVDSTRTVVVQAGTTAALDFFLQPVQGVQSREVLTVGVLDAAGAVLPGVLVRFTSGSMTRESVTDSRGFAVFSAVPVGPFTVAVIQNAKPTVSTEGAVVAGAANRATLTLGSTPRTLSSRSARKAKPRSGRRK